MDSFFILFFRGFIFSFKTFFFKCLFKGVYPLSKFQTVITPVIQNMGIFSLRYLFMFWLNKAWGETHTLCYRAWGMTAGRTNFPTQKIKWIIIIYSNLRSTQLIGENLRQVGSNVSLRLTCGALDWHVGY